MSALGTPPPDPRWPCLWKSTGACDNAPLDDKCWPCQIRTLRADLAQAQRSLDELHGAPFSQRVYVAMKARAEAAEQQGARVREEMETLRTFLAAIVAEMEREAADVRHVYW